MYRTIPVVWMLGYVASRYRSVYRLNNLYHLISKLFAETIKYNLRAGSDRIH
jgi:hypothetical protein